MEVSVKLEGLLAPGAMDAWTADQRKRIAERAKQGMRDARPKVDEILKTETRKAFKLAAGDKFLRAWRRNLDVSDPENPRLIVRNVAKWFAVHVSGGTIGPKTTPRAVLIPINTRLGSRLGTKKFYKLIAWLRQNKMTVVLNGILYVRPAMNTSRRGGVAAGTRVQKSFRNKFSGALKRPSGFEIKLNEHGLTPIAIIRSRVQMRRRFDLETIGRDRIAPVVADAVQRQLALG